MLLKSDNANHIVFLMFPPKTATLKGEEHTTPPVKRSS